MKSQVLFNQYRFNYLLSIWNTSVTEYANKLRKKGETVMADKVAYSMDEELVNKLLKLYLSHCKFKHAFAFIQFRKLLPGAKVQDLVEMFTRRK